MSHNHFTPFQWDDALRLTSELTEDERAIRDAANLAWKLHAVMRSGADPELLDSYGSERLPHVQAFIELAVRLGGIIQTTNPQEARERDARFRAGQPEIFHYPTPRLGPGLTHGDDPWVGQVFPQPELIDGRLMDSARSATSEGGSAVCWRRRRASTRCCRD